jgi:cell division protein FtsZ
LEADSKFKVKAENPINEIEKITPRRDYLLNVEQQEIEKKSNERIQRLKDLSIKLKSPQEIDQMEKTPAYLRRNVELSDVKHSSESEISRFTLGEDDDKNGEIKTNNSFLHDNVD